VHVVRVLRAPNGERKKERKNGRRKEEAIVEAVSS